MIPQKLK